MIVPNNTKGIYDWDLKNKSFGVEVTYSCPTEGWGYPSNGLNTMKSVCQADKSWTITSMDDCMRQSKSLGDKTFLFTTFFQYCHVQMHRLKNQLEVGNGTMSKIRGTNVQMGGNLNKETTLIGTLTVP